MFDSGLEKAAARVVAASGQLGGTDVRRWTGGAHRFARPAPALAEDTRVTTDAALLALARLPHTQAEKIT